MVKCEREHHPTHQHQTDYQNNECSDHIKFQTWIQLKQPIYIYTYTWSYICMYMYIFHIKLTQKGGIGKGQKSSGN